jgi:plasmid stability protein
VQKLLFLGSSCIYPRMAQQPMTESALLTGTLEPTNEPMAWLLLIPVFWTSDYNAIIEITRGYRMTSITVRNLDESIKAGLRLRAARHGWSMEQEVRQILRQAVAPEQQSAISFAEQINQRFAGLQAEALPLPARVAVRTPPTLD